jgi:hypothetical protein
MKSLGVQGHLLLLLFSYSWRFLGMICYLTHNLCMVISFSTLQSCVFLCFVVYMFSPTFTTSFYHVYCNFIVFFYSLCFYKTCPFKVVFFFGLILHLVLQAYDVIMCAYDANESNRMCDAPFFFQMRMHCFKKNNEQCYNLAPLSTFICVYALLGSKELGDWVKVWSTIWYS